MSDAIHFAGSLSRTLVTGEQTKGVFSLLMNLQPAGNMTPPHRHRRETEVPCVLEGTLTVEADGETIGLGVGAAAVLSKNHGHRLSNRTDEATRYLLLCAPAGFERFVATVGEPSTVTNPRPKPMTADQNRRLVECAPEFGIDLLAETSLTEPDGRRVRRPSKETMDIIGILIEVLAELGEGPRDPVLLQVVVPPGVVVPVHRHNETEWFFVLDGQLDVYVEGTWTSGEVGALLSVPGNARHALHNAGNAPARAICVTTAPLLRFFRDAGARVGAEPPGPPSPERMRRLVDVAMAHGQTFGDPTEQAAAGLG